MSFTIGSLFDGSGGFPLAASLCGGVPKWAAEVEPYPISVTKSRFPDMKHLGSVTDIKGSEVEPVDVITFGAPCQDLSVAGLRKGLRHGSLGDEETTRSGLFMEAVRIIKEMREATNGVYPRFAIYENVPGAFSSSKGEDFRIVLEELIKIVEPTAVMPPVPEKGWPYADSYCGDGWSIAYRVLDAQFWGVPQRRRRIYLVADFRGECAEKVSFEREGLRGYFETGRTPWQTIAGDAEAGSGTADCEGIDGYNSTLTGDKSSTLGVNCGMSTGRNGVVYAVDQGGGKSGANFHNNLSPTLTCTHGGEPAVAYSINHQGGNVEQIIEDKTGTLTAAMNSSGNNKLSVAYTLKIRSGCEGGGKGALVQENMSATLATNNDQYLFQPICFEPGAASRLGGYCYEDKCGTLRATMGDNQFAVAYTTPVVGIDSYNLCETGSVGRTLSTPCGGLNEHIPCVYYSEGVVPQTWDARGNVDGKVVSTITGGHECSISDFTSVVMEPIPVHDQATRFSGKHGNKSDGKGNGLGVGNPGDPMNTLTSGDRHAVAFQTYQKVTGPLMANSHPGSYTGQDAFSDMLVAGKEEKPVVIDRAFFNQGENAKYDPAIYTDGTVPTLIARGPSAVAVRYIVRRLTPTECARLQGFPDSWGHPIEKTELTDEEYQFWLNVRNTHAVINEKATKEYTKDQMLKWYNSLHTDSSEYKMWGNGIALPNALYVMQGIADVMTEEKASRKKWLDDLLGDCL